MKRINRIVSYLALGALLSACSITRHIPDGEYLLQKVHIEADDSVERSQKIHSYDLEQYIRQEPNTKILGLRIGAWIYEQAKPEKSNGWNNWKRKIGEKPVLLDMQLTKKSAENLKVYMDSKGFFTSQSSYSVDTTSRKKRAIVTYRTVQNEPYIIDSIEYEFRDKFLRQIILPDTTNSLIRKGDVFDITMLDSERERITKFLRERGYYNFTVNNIQYVADTLQRNNRVGLKLIVRQHIKGYTQSGEPIRENSMVYRISNVNIYTNFDPAEMRRDSTLITRLDTTYYRGLNIIYDKQPNIRPLVLRQRVPLYPNYLFNSSQVDRTYNELIALGYFRSAKVSFTEREMPQGEQNLISYVGSGDSADSTLYTKEGYLDCDILCTPTLKQSFKVELEGSTTSSFYGLKAILGYQNRNIFRGAEALDITFSTGYEFMTSEEASQDVATEYELSTALTLPRFLVPWDSYSQRTTQQKTKLEVAVNLQDRPYYQRTLSSAAITYEWRNRRYSSFSFSPIDINVVDVQNVDPEFLESTNNKYLQESFRTQFIGGMSFGYNYNNQLKNLGGDATNVRANFETAGNLIGAANSIFNSKNSSQIFGIQYAQYFRTDLSVSHKIKLGKVTALAGRIYGGVAMAYENSTAVPFDRQFYCGGSNSMRGWAPRTLGQGSVPNPHNDFPVQTGDVKLEANLEFRFPIWGMFHGATFFDVGNVWYIRQNEQEYSNDAVFKLDNFYNQLGFNTGFGIRLDIKFAVIRLDWGVQLHNPNNPVGERWISALKWENTALNFGVGYPF